MIRGSCGYDRFQLTIKNIEYVLGKSICADFYYHYLF